MLGLAPLLKSVKCFLLTGEKRVNKKGDASGKDTLLLSISAH